MTVKCGFAAVENTTTAVERILDAELENFKQKLNGILPGISVRRSSHRGVPRGLATQLRQHPNSRGIWPATGRAKPDPVAESAAGQMYGALVRGKARINFSLPLAKEAQVPTLLPPRLAERILPVFTFAVQREEAVGD